MDKIIKIKDHQPPKCDYVHLGEDYPKIRLEIVNDENGNANMAIDTGTYTQSKALAIVDRHIDKYKGLGHGDTVRKLKELRADIFEMELLQ